MDLEILEGQTWVAPADFWGPVKSVLAGTMAIAPFVRQFRQTLDAVRLSQSSFMALCKRLGLANECGVAEAI